METALKQIRRSPYQALAAVFIITITFFVSTMLATLGYGFSNTLHFYETKPRVIADLANEATPEETSSFQRNLLANPQVKDVEFITKQQAFERYKEYNRDDPRSTEFLDPKSFPASIEFTSTDISFISGLMEEARREKIVDEVYLTLTFDNDPENLARTIENLKTTTKYIRIGGGVVLGFLGVSSFFVILTIIGMRIASRREEIGILQLIGATAGFIRKPFILEAVIYSTLGSFAGWLAALLLVLYALPTISSYFQEVEFIPTEVVKLLEMFGIILGAEVLLAIILGSLGGFVAIKRYIKI